MIEGVLFFLECRDGICRCHSGASMKENSKQEDDHEGSTVNGDSGNRLMWHKYWSSTQITKKTLRLLDLARCSGRRRFHDESKSSHTHFGERDAASRGRVTQKLSTPSPTAYNRVDFSFIPGAIALDQGRK